MRPRDRHGSAPSRALSSAWRTVAGALAFAALSSLVACAGSNPSIVDAQRRFERCYVLDEDAAASEGQKLACWQTWSAHDGARPDMDMTRVHYARERLRVHASVSAEPVSAPIVGVSPAAAPMGSVRRGR